MDLWDVVPDLQTTTRIVPTKKAEQQIVLEHREKIKKSNIDFMEIAAVDESSIPGANRWTLCQDEAMSKFLNKQCLEQSQLFIYKG